MTGLVAVGLTAVRDAEHCDHNLVVEHLVQHSGLCRRCAAGFPVGIVMWAVLLGRNTHGIDTQLSSKGEQSQNVLSRIFHQSPGALRLRRLMLERLISSAL